ncbi:TPA: hypothetical protein EYO12_03920 [Candidatus Saccharibacteria bacterium]|nr:hypothetical protein [Candidatus Saccharibacteria bacterium]HIO87817.1 hypothetical protein [Candidatus Saccharibacteria bacterium]
MANKHPVINPVTEINDNRPEYSSQRHDHDDMLLNWEASEYVMHHKTPLWYASLAGAAIALSGLLYWITGDILTVLVILLMTAALAVYATRQPQTLRYSMSDSTIVVGHKEFHFTDFKSFSIIHDGSFYSINMVPTKRFAPPLSIYFDEKDADKIMEIMTRHLPHVEKEPDPIDKLSKYLRF